MPANYLYLSVSSNNVRVAPLTFANEKVFDLWETHQNVIQYRQLGVDRCDGGGYPFETDSSAGGVLSIGIPTGPGAPNLIY